jgi:hypothetical protein
MSKAEMRKLSELAGKLAEDGKVQVKICSTGKKTVKPSDLRHALQTGKKVVPPEKAVARMENRKELLSKIKNFFWTEEEYNLAVTFCLGL